ncbi:Meiotic nuclear division protein 1-like protein [Trichoplax sp. H2]|nr:Meiotic nuclear division protein 1-like protein [Trichoplax sp. H2]|eukprot:RDD46548.1 Meiotic nuclear division protein 1-like protein [Trichoplax sp. H2]
MSKRRGLSFEEKRSRMLELFYETKNFYQLKELEKIAQKQKGITSMSVKDVLQSLVDDAMVEQDKIGTSNYFWSFPSKATNQRKRKLETLKSQISECEMKKKKLQQSKDDHANCRKDTDKRKKLLEKIEELSSRRDSLTVELRQYQGCDPELVEEAKLLKKVSLEAANRWTDNIFSIKSWCRNKFCFEDKVIDKQFGIPEDFDYVE